MADIDVIMAKLNELDFKLSNIPATAAAPVAEIINTEELCKRLDISERSIADWRRKNKIPFIRVDGVIRYNWPSVVAHLENKNRGK